MDKTYSLLTIKQRQEFLQDWTKEGGLSGAHLKMLACAFMLLDHISQGDMLFDLWGIGGGQIFNFWQEPSGQMIASIMVLLGRIAFPLYCFFLIQGIFLTKDYIKYLSRLLVFGLISEIPFDLALFGQVSFLHQNIFFTLFLGASMILFIEKSKERIGKKWLNVVASFLCFLLFSFLADFFHTDYGSMGIFAILCLYIFPFQRIKTLLMGIVGFSFEMAFYMTVYLSLPLIYLYNGKRGKMNKYFFYLFYPLHLSLIYIIRDYVIPYFFVS